MNITVYPANLRIRSKADALKFYGYIKHCVIMPLNYRYYLRVEPNNLIGVVSKADVDMGNAWIVPNFHDEDGSIAYHYRKCINAWLKGERR